MLGTPDDQLERTAGRPEWLTKTEQFSPASYSIVPPLKELMKKLIDPNWLQGKVLTDSWITFHGLRQLL
jgi:hypothetical protein